MHRQIRTFYSKSLLTKISTKRFFEHKSLRFNNVEIRKTNKLHALLKKSRNFDQRSLLILFLIANVLAIYIRQLLKF